MNRIVMVSCWWLASTCVAAAYGLVYGWAVAPLAFAATLILFEAIVVLP